MHDKRTTQIRSGPKGHNCCTAILNPVMARIVAWLLSRASWLIVQNDAKQSSSAHFGSTTLTTDNNDTNCTHRESAISTTCTHNNPIHCEDLFSSSREREASSITISQALETAIVFAARILIAQHGVC